jgi:hypothetical protein
MTLTALRVPYALPRLTFLKDQTDAQ